LWWEVAIHRTVKFIRKWGRMIAHNHMYKLKEARQELEEIRTSVAKIFDFS
jgi:hypothetical protein